MPLSRVGVACALILLMMSSLQATEVPQWRDSDPSARFLGPDRFWRCRDTLVFAMHDATGTGFGLDIDVRDMNVYLQGPRPTMIFILAPGGQIVTRQLLADDGITSGDARYHDGIPDMYGDFRYRSWHRHNSPTGVPPDRERSPSLSDPGQLPARTVRLRVPAAGQGLYRLVIIGTWDNWISVTPSRPLATAISPGPAPLYVHGDQLDDSWLYAPVGTQDIGFAISEEVQPWSWSLRVSDETGQAVTRVTPKGPYNFGIARGVPAGSVLRLDFDVGSPGACLHVDGAPLYLAPDAATARLLHGTVEHDDKGRATYHPYQRVLNAWADSLDPADLAVDVQDLDPEQPVGDNPKLKLGDVQTMLAAQILDPTNPKFGDFESIEDPRLSKLIHPFWNPPAKHLGVVAGWQDPANPYYGNPAITRRVMLYLVTQRFATQSSYLWYDTGDKPQTFPETFETFWQLPYRSNWYPLQDANFAKMLGPLRESLPYALPSEVNEAWSQSVRSWVVGRTVAQQGECTNQWAKGLEHLVNIWAATRDYGVEQVMHHQIETILTPGVLGRVNPDPDPWWKRSTVNQGGGAADAGIIGGAIPAEAYGHDGEYALETVSHLAYIHSKLPNPKIIDWLNEYYQLKTHLTLPKSGDWPVNSFSHTVSPTDTNHRTRYYTHKSGLYGAEADVRYGRIWNNQTDSGEVWPVFEAEDFVRSIDDRYHFVKTGSYYAVVYTGPTNPYYSTWTEAVVGDGTADLQGYGRMNYGGLGYKAAKLGAISAVWVPGCGPVLLCQNHNVMYTNTVWLRLAEPISPVWKDEFVDPTIVAEAMDQPDSRFDVTSRRLLRETRMAYAPLTITREARFLDGAIDMTLRITASEDVDVQEAYEAIPLYGQDRQVRVFGADWQETPYELPEAMTAPTGREAPPAEMRGPMPDAPAITAKALDVTGKDGAGALIVFDQAYRFTQTQPVRYRSVAAAVGGFNLELPRSWKKGATVTVRYRILPHAAGQSAESLRQLGSEE